NLTTTIYISTLSLHDALPISAGRRRDAAPGGWRGAQLGAWQRRRGALGWRPIRAAASGGRSRSGRGRRPEAAADAAGAGGGDRSDRKSTRLNSSHRTISYAVF